MKRALAAVLAALALSGTVACDNTTSGNDGASSPSKSTSNPSPGELSDVQRTLDAIESDMAGDPAP